MESGSGVFQSHLQETSAPPLPDCQATARRQVTEYPEFFASQRKRYPFPNSKVNPKSEKKSAPGIFYFAKRQATLKQQKPKQRKNSLRFAFRRLTCPPVTVSKKRKQPSKTMLLGMWLDADGHKRITPGPGDNFILLGSGEETHEEMVEKAIQINEKLAHKGKQLEKFSTDEFDEIRPLRQPAPPSPAKTRKITIPPKKSHETNKPLSQHSLPIATCALVFAIPRSSKTLQVHPLIDEVNIVAEKLTKPKIAPELTYDNQPFSDATDKWFFVKDAVKAKQKMRNACSEIMQDYARKYCILKSPQSIRNHKRANSDLSRAREKLDTSLNIERAIPAQMFSIAKQDFANSHSFVLKTFSQETEEVKTAETNLREAKAQLAKAKKTYTDAGVANKQSNSVHSKKNFTKHTINSE